MKSKMRKKLIAFMLCMVLVICNSVSILADTPAAETTTAEKQVKETKSTEDESEFKEDKAAGDEEEESKQSEETEEEDSDQEEAPEVKTTEKKKETAEADTEKKEDKTDKADEATTKSKDETSKADETTTEAKDETSEAETTTKDETTEAEGKTADTTEAEETGKTTEKKDDAEKADDADKNEAAPTELTYEDDDVKVTVSAVAENAIPEGAELRVVPILKNDTDTQAQYTEVEQKIQEKAAETETEVKGFLAYDITFVDKDGNEIEPNSEVKVSMEYKQAAIPAGLSEEDAKDTEVSVLHLEEDSDGNVAKVVDMGEAGKIDALETTDAKQVEKVEVKTESFSAYTIVWRVWYEEKDRVTIHYVDVDGNSLDDKVQGGNSYQDGDEKQIELADSEYNVTIPGYEYRYATVARSFKSAPESTVIIDKLRLESGGYGRYNIQYQYSSYYAGKQWKSFEDNQSVYMVYGVDSSGGGSTGGGSSATGNLAHRKYVTVNDDGTYDLTLNVTGAVGTEANPAKVDIVFALDLSGSMQGTNIRDAKSAANTLIDTLADNRTVDAKWKLVTFNNSATIKTSTWKSSQEMKNLVGFQNAVNNTGTNYEAGLRKAGDAIGAARSDAIKIVVFLTDGQPTYHGTSASGGGSYTNDDDYTGALKGAATITCDRFYAIGMDLTDNVGLYEYTGIFGGKYEEQKGPAISGEELLLQVANNVHANPDNKYVQNVDENGDLSSVFSDIAGSITRYTASKVSIKDTLTDEVDQVAGTKLVVKVTDKNGNDVTKAEQETGEISATYDESSKQLKLDFAASYELKQDYTYSVTIKIQPNEAAKETYIKNGYTYTDTGEVGTGETSAGKLGIFSNKKDSATVTWTTNSQEITGKYNCPVVQIPDEDLPVKAKTEPVNFYLNLSSKILDTDGSITGQENGDFTTSVSGDQSGNREDGQGIGVPINEDFRVVIPQDQEHVDHKTIYDGWVYGVIGGESKLNAKEVDKYIRKLGTAEGAFGNQTGTEDEWYQIVDGNGDPAFPTDEEIFQYIRDNWANGVSKGKDIKVNEEAIDVDNLTTDNFAIRWYVFKDQKADYWHIDGILVPKSGLLNITKTFSNKEVADQLADTFAIEVKGDFLGNEDSTKRLTLNQASITGGTTENEPVTYTWPSLAVFGDSYKVKETGYQDDLTDWSYESTNYTYTKDEVEVDSGNKCEVTINTDRTGNDEEPIVQTLAFTNNYGLKATNLDLKKTSKNGEYITGAEFKLSQKQESGKWEVIDKAIEVSNDETVELNDLVTGEIYKLEEIQAPEAHMLLGEPIYFTVEDGTVKLCDENGVTNPDAGTDEMWSLDQEETVAILTIKNNILYDLPSAGGPGIYWYTISGTLLMAGAALIVYKEKRKREVLLRK